MCALIASSRSGGSHTFVRLVPLGVALAASLACLARRAAPPEREQVVEARGRHCTDCHSDTLTLYDRSLHAAIGIQCQQCHYQMHRPAGSGQVTDLDCASCHHEEFVQGQDSLHYQTAQPAPIDEETDHDALSSGLFTRDHLCIACHYNGHEFHLDNVRAEDFCDSCHDRANHPVPLPTNENQSNVCIRCHVRTAVSPSGRNVNNHRFPSRRE